MAELLVALDDYPAALLALRHNNHRLLVCENTIDDILDKLGNGRVEIVCISSQAAYNGWQLLRIIRSGRFCPPELPVIMIGDAQWRSHEIQFAEELACTLASRVDDIITLVECCSAEIARSKPSILVIEDDEETAHLSRTALQTQAVVELALDGVSGLNAWKLRRHDLVLLDVQLPGLNGADVLEEMLVLQPQQAIVIFSADTTNTRYRAMMSAGASDYLTKPLDLAELRARCRSILQFTAYRNQRDYQQQMLDKQRIAARRLRAADTSLSCGQTQSAFWHVKHALATLPYEELSDDDCASLY